MQPVFTIYALAAVLLVSCESREETAAVDEAENTATDTTTFSPGYPDSTMADSLPDPGSSTGDMTYQFSDDPPKSSRQEPENTLIGYSIPDKENPEKGDKKFRDGPDRKKDGLYVLFEEKFADYRKMREDFCECQLSAEIQVTYDEMDKIYGIKFEKNSRPQYDSLFVSFLKSIPPKTEPSPFSDPMSETRKLIIRHKDQVDVEKAEYDFNRKYNAFLDTSMVVTNSQELDSYILVANKTGWINCDRFASMPGKRIRFYAGAASVPAFTSVWLIFKSLRTILPGDRMQDNNFGFIGMPSGATARLMAISYEEAQPRIAMVDIRLSEEKVRLTNFQTFTLSELNNVLKFNF